MAGDEMTPCEEELRRLIVQICEIIHFQEPLRNQDAWVRDMVKRRIYTPEDYE